MKSPAQLLVRLAAYAQRGGMLPDEVNAAAEEIAKVLRNDHVSQRHAALLARYTALRSSGRSRAEAIRILVETSMYCRATVYRLVSSHETAACSNFPQGGRSD